MADWRFLTNHAQVLFCIAEDSNRTLRELADCVGITERRAHRIVSELVDDGYVSRRKEGRRNHYAIRTDLPLRHRLQQDHTVGDLLAALNGGRRQRKPAPR